jgi:hypothetical protein
MAVSPSSVSSTEQWPGPTHAASVTRMGAPSFVIGAFGEFPRATPTAYEAFA